MYPTTIPTINGMILKNPLALVITSVVIKNVTSATSKPFHSKISAFSPIRLTANPASDKPIIIIIGPITIGGNNLLIQFLPANFTTNANIT